MSGGDDSAAQAPLQVAADVADDQRSLMLRLGDGDDAPLVVAMETASVDALIAALGAARSQMLEPIPADIEGTFNITAYDPRWMIWPDAQNMFATFWIRHPGLGWSFYAFSRNEAGNIARWLRKVTSINETTQTQSPRASSFGSKESGFLLSTEGLGFYYYGKGEKHIGPNPFEQVEFDSDRAAGIVAGSIAETRLAQALQSRLKNDKPALITNLFQPSGAFGPFRIKIDLAYLMGVITEKAFKDLTTIKDIRNDFAHKLDIDTFDVQSVKDRCKNLKIVDDFVGPVPGEDSKRPPIPPEQGEPRFYMGLPDYETRIVDPRFRFTMTAQLISNHLGEGADNLEHPLPLI